MGDTIYYMGKPISELPRRELEEAIKAAMDYIQSLRHSLDEAFKLAELSFHR